MFTAIDTRWADRHPLSFSTSGHPFHGRHARRRASADSIESTGSTCDFESVTPLCYVPDLILKKVMLESNCPQE
jgi:hypothetical protein